MEHTCLDCEHSWFDNEAGGLCPECGSTDIQSLFDEELEEGPDEWDPEEGDSWVITLWE
jgi:hypothetical protein